MTGVQTCALPILREVHQDFEALAHDRVRLAAVDVYDKANAARVVLVARVIQALGGREAVVHVCVHSYLFRRRAL